MVSYLFHLQLVFCLASNQNDILLAMCVVVLLHLSSTTTSLRMIILILVIWDHLDFNIRVESLIFKRRISSEKLFTKFVHIIISLLIITITSTLRLFWVKPNIVIQLLLYLNLDILPRKIRQFYFSIHNLNNVRFTQVKGLNHFFRLRFKIGEKVWNSISFLMRCFALMLNLHGRRHCCFILLLNIFFKLLCDRSNDCFLGFLTQDKDLNLLLIILISLFYSCESWLNFVTICGQHILIEVVYYQVDEVDVDRFVIVRLGSNKELLFQRKA